MTLKRKKCNPNCVEMASFFEKLEKLLSGGKLCPQNPVCDTRSCSSVLSTPLNTDIFLRKKFNFWSKPPFSKILVARLLIGTTWLYLLHHIRALCD